MRWISLVSAGVLVLTILVTGITTIFHKEPVYEYDMPVDRAVYSTFKTKCASVLDLLTISEGLRYESWVRSHSDDVTNGFLRMHYGVDELRNFGYKYKAEPRLEMTDFMVDSLDGKVTRCRAVADLYENGIYSGQDVFEFRVVCERIDGLMTYKVADVVKVPVGNV